MILKRYNRDDILNSLVDLKSFKPFPVAADRDDWDRLLGDSLNQERKEWACAEAEKLLDQPWPQLNATLYMEFVRNGNRSNYEGPYFARRKNLGVLVVAECFEYKGRFLDEIINGLWQMLGEPTWCVPAHAWRRDGDPLPTDRRHSVDLFACESAMVAAEAYYLLRNELESISPSLCDRIRHKILSEIVEPLEQFDDFWWFCGRNNWTPWCSSNALGAALYLIDDQERAANFIARIAEIVDRFIAKYPDDGGCDEGPGYWGASPGALLMFLELLYSYTNGRISIYDEPKIKDMGEFIDKIHINKSWFANFADAGAKSGVNRVIGYRYGERVGSDRMKYVARMSSRGWQEDGPIRPFFVSYGCGGLLMGAVRDLFWLDVNADAEKVAIPKAEWLSEIEVMVARETSAYDQGYTLISKGGHNAENHNHNDVGQFILFANGSPVIVDIGVSTYTRKTFSSERYDIWCIRASGHNVPLINGFEQYPAFEAKAVNVEYNTSDNLTSVKMDLVKAYPEDAKLDSVWRTVSLDRENEAVQIHDDIKANEGEVNSIINLYSPVKPEESEAGIHLIDDSINEILQYDSETLEFSWEAVDIEDGSLQRTWGETLYKMVFRGKSESGSLNYKLTFKHAKV